MSKMTVSLASSRQRSRANTETSSADSNLTSKTSKKSDKLNAGLPQMNKAKKADFKKMKKQRRRRGWYTTR